MLELGTISVSANTVCVGDMIAFAATGVVNQGSLSQRVNCVVVGIGHVPPTYNWVITKPDTTTVSGPGPIATVVADLGGTYSVIFTVTAQRDCPPTPRLLLASAEAADIASVVWEEFDPASTPLDTCPNNGGRRIFPGKAHPVDLSAGIRAKVALKATVTPIVQGCTVHFRVWDVDDPFDQNNPAMVGVGIIDANTTGPDNRPGPESPQALSGTTDANGEVRVSIDVSMQPGNNYRAGVSVDSAQIGATTQTQADTNSPPTQVVFTDMLTVWRKLHVEIDSMGAEPSTVSGRSPDWDSVSVDSVVNGTNSSTLTLTSQTTLLGGLASGEADHYEGGTLTVTGLAPALFLVGSTSDTVEVDRVLSAAEITTVTGAFGVLRDDDPTTPAQLPMYPTISPFVSGVYAKAYLEILAVPVTENPNRQVAFDLNLNDAEVTFGTGWDNAQDIFSEPGYWAALLVTAFQPGGSADQDSHASLGDNANQWGTNFDPDESLQIGITVEDSDNASLVFIEVLRDIGAMATKDLDHTIAHEIGHSGGPNISADVEHAEAGIMTVGAPADETAFTAATLKRFREANPW